MQQTEIGAFVLNTPFFKKHELASLSNNVLEILFYNGAIDCFCPKCNSHSIFLGENDDSDRAQRKINIQVGSYSHNGISDRSIDFTGTYLLDFYCSRNKEHKINIIFKIDNQKLFKIGQSPSVLEIIKGDFKQYKSMLGESFYDLNSAILLHSNNFGIAAFTHLRRIIENFFMVQACNTWESKNSFDPKPKYNELRFKEKMDLVKDYLPQTFTENPTLYSIASSGIHSLTEEQCIEYFTPLKDCIILCLDEMLSELKKQTLKNSVKASLEKIASFIKK
ncbi:hypothetical protein HDE69_004824 [Pedobacter cryoconitis]|uniref:Uncharacterized protein n=1 Tax=Pedobacter cryoconitis TaxID=188932 RepID=A0A7W9DLX8_9SPHI|nr:hypothetical protein [Pedobacter cryoconitis]MBB5623737.1 hypothetical protein [Pedobacter cryoconitis]